jgi:DNA (cytosine-5)-methyltransferase 1
MKFIDLFAGIGGIKIAFENAGFDCVFSNDFDKNSKINMFQCLEYRQESFY